MLDFYARSLAFASKFGTSLQERENSEMGYFPPFWRHETAPEELFWPSKKTISTPFKTKTTPHFSKIAPLCIRFGYLIQGYFSPVYRAKTTPFQRGWISPKNSMYFTQRNGPILGAKTDLFDLQCIYRILTVSHFRFTCYLQNLDSLPFSIFMLFTESWQSTNFDLHVIHRILTVSLFRFTCYLQNLDSLPFFDLHVI